MPEFFDAPSHLLSPPTARAAYSDRTAWVMAEISRLVYSPLPEEISVTRLADEIHSAVEAGEATDTVAALIRRAIDSEKEVSSDTETMLRTGKFELLDTFSKDGTEAFLARMESDDESDGMLVLAFRGTQPNITDVLSDIKADLTCAPNGGQVHRGFMEAFEKIRDQVDQALDHHSGPPVYITGHSLGGALALIATRYLEKNSSGACYTFGAPRVGDDRFFDKIKTPIYRIVNAADGVPRVPFGFGLKLVLGGLRLIPFNGTLAISEWIRRHFVGYTHHGTLIFLSPVSNTTSDLEEPYSNLDIRKAPNFFWQSSHVLSRLASSFGKAAFTDHSIRDYSEKLKAYAIRRNPKSIARRKDEP